MSDSVKFELAASIPGYIKVRLFFGTWEPKHLRSHFLKTEARAVPPFFEDLSVLVPVTEAFNRLTAYQDIFNRLKSEGILARADHLVKYEIHDEDDHTLAWYEPKES